MLFSDFEAEGLKKLSYMSIDKVLIADNDTNVHQLPGSLYFISSSLC